MQLRLIPNWRELWLKLWSVRLILVAALMSAIEAGVSLYFDGRPIAALIACAVSLAAAVARIVAQPAAVVKAEEEVVTKELVEAGVIEPPPPWWRRLWNWFVTPSA